LPNIVRVIKSIKMRLAGHGAQMREMRNLHKILIGYPQEKRPFGILRHSWENNSKMDLRDVDSTGSG
jgi:hypothetical protein